MLLVTLTLNSLKKNTIKETTEEEKSVVIPKPHFWICIYPFQTGLFHLKFMISAMTLILI